MRVVEAPSSQGILGARTPGGVRRYSRCFPSCVLAVSQSVVDIATGIGAGRTGVHILLVDFLICVHVQTGCRSHPAFTLMGIGILSLG